MKAKSTYNKKSKIHHKKGYNKQKLKMEASAVEKE